jgi:hypothetical protein
MCKQYYYIGSSDDNGIRYLPQPNRTNKRREQTGRERSVEAVAVRKGNRARLLTVPQSLGSIDPSTTQRGDWIAGPRLDNHREP